MRIDGDRLKESFLLLRQRSHRNFHWSILLNQSEQKSSSISSVCWKMNNLLIASFPFCCLLSLFELLFFSFYLLSCVFPFTPSPLCLCSFDDYCDALKHSAMSVAAIKSLFVFSFLFSLILCKHSMSSSWLCSLYCNGSVETQFITIYKEIQVPFDGVSYKLYCLRQTFKTASQYLKWS